MSETIRRIPIANFDYPLPEERIARFPLSRRDASKLLVNSGGKLSEDTFGNIGAHLSKGAMLVFNNTRVIRARLIFHKPSGARVEIFCLEPHAPADYERAFAAKGKSRWVCIVGNLRRWKEGPVEIHFPLEGREYTLSARRIGGEGDNHIIEFTWDVDMAFGQLLETLGRIPIPPYLNRESEEIDLTRYQTVYSKIEGSVAAPTAGLHFTPELISSMKGEGFSFGEVTLHVGAGTFLPVKGEDAAAHAMHTEHFEITLETIECLRARLGKIVAVGTTSVRTLESLGALGWRIMGGGDVRAEEAIGQWEIYDIPDNIPGGELLDTLIGYMKGRKMDKLSASTRIMITPGYRFRIVDTIITNFHQPKSTLLLLVGAYLGEEWKDMYRYALGNDFRFLSYGDSCLLKRG